MECIIKNSGEYQTLLHRSGLSPFKLDSEIISFKEKHGRFPELDEIKGADSSKALESDLKIKLENKVHSSEKILKGLGAKDVKEALIIANNIYKDKEIRMVDMGDFIYMDVSNRPSKVASKVNELDKIDPKILDITRKVFKDPEFANIGTMKNYLEYYTSMFPEIELIDKFYTELKEKVPFIGSYADRMKFKEYMEDKRKNINTLPDIAYFSEVIDRLLNLYGMNFKSISNDELATQEWREKVPDGLRASAFIYNGDIYLNVDNMKSDSKIHEMLHILFGSTKYTSPELYNSIVNEVEKLPNYEEESKKYLNRVRSDINEEITVTLMAKLMTGQKSIFDNIDSNIIYEIRHNIFRALDTVIKGKDSIEKLIPKELMNSSIKELSLKLGSTEFDGGASYISRALNNRKSELLKSGVLKEICI